MEEGHSLDERIALRFNAVSGTGYISRLEVVNAAEKVWPGSAGMVGSFFDRFIDPDKRGTMRLYDFALGLSKAYAEKELSSVEDEDEKRIQSLFYVWDAVSDAPVEAHLHQQEKVDVVACRQRLAFLLAMQWMSAAGTSSKVETFENQVGGHKGDAEMKAAGDTIMKPLNLQVNFFFFFFCSFACC